jgi:hypothetical protein
MGDIFSRLWHNLAGRITGPMNFRIIMQPSMAAGFAIWSGIKDARADRRAFLWSIIIEPDQRSTLLRSAWKDVGRIFILAVVLDAVYQLIQLHAIHLLELLIIAPTLSFVPYVLVRGPVTRLIAAFTRDT